MPERRREAEVVTTVAEHNVCVDNIFEGHEV